MASHGPRATTASSRGTQMRRSLEQNLSGIDDPKVLRAINRRCLWKGRSYGPVLAVAVPVMVALCVAVKLLTNFVPWCAEHGGVLWILPGAVGGVLVGAYINLGLKKALPEVLRSMGRCESCGYSLTGATTDRCPECGEPISTESKTGK